jgi:hypothetical protein
MLAFHPNDKPRGWVRTLVGFDKQRNASGPLRFIAFDRAGDPRPPFAPWVNRALKVRAPEQLERWFVERDEIVETAILADAKTLTILASPHTLFIARFLASCLDESRLQVEVRSEFSHDNSDIYIVIAPQYFDVRPPSHKCIFFQVEQSTTDRWFTDEYLDLLQSGLGIFDYSLSNISFLRRHSIPLKFIFHTPLAPLPNGQRSPEKDIDVLFYGNASPERRMRYIKKLRKHFNIRVVTKTFGDEMRSIIRRARVVVNIHAYEDALLETTRLCEVASEGTAIVSESSIDQLAHDQFNECVKFVPSGDVEAMILEIAASLESDSDPKPDLESFKYAKFMMLRAFLGLGIISPDEFILLTSWCELPSDRLVLSLPEETDRYGWCQAQRLDGYAVFPGLRRQPGWKGCGLSYRYMAQKALDAGYEELRIYEDDAGFPSFFSESISVVDNYLKSRMGDWDIFSGMISDISSSASISEVVEYKDMTFIHLDQMIGLVFGIYKPSALEKIARWDWRMEEQPGGHIDRYLERDRRLRIITTDPFICHHKSDFHSSIWESHNMDTQAMITRSAQRFSKMVQKYRSARAGID